MADFKIQIDENDDAVEAQAHQSESKKPKKRGSRKLSKKQLKIAIALVVILTIVGIYFYQTNKINNLRAENEKLSDPQQSAQQEAEQIKGEVSKLIELPDETPTVATVADVEKLRDQSFFTNAHNGDRVLLFAEAKKAILYRPDTGKIIEVAPINIGDQEGAKKDN